MRFIFYQINLIRIKEKEDFSTLFVQLVYCSIERKNMSLQFSPHFARVTFPNSSIDPVLLSLFFNLKIGKLRLYLKALYQLPCQGPGGSQNINTLCNFREKHGDVG